MKNVPTENRQQRDTLVKYASLKNTTVSEILRWQLRQLIVKLQSDHDIYERE